MATLYDLFNQNQVETNSVFCALCINFKAAFMYTQTHTFILFLHPKKKMRSTSVCCMQMANACEYFHLKLSKFVFGKYILACKLCAFEWFCSAFYLFLSLSAVNVAIVGLENPYLSTQASVEDSWIYSSF